MAEKKDRGSQKAQRSINVELPESVADGVYSNLALITHSPAEFVIDFSRMLPGVPKAKIHARVVMAPQHAKSFLNALSENISRFEQRFGKIDIHPKKGRSEIEFLPPVTTDDPPN